MSRLLQIVSPFNERLKQCAHKTHCVIFTEVVCHILLPLIFIAICLTPLVYFDFFIGDFKILIGVEITLIVFVLFFSSCLIFASFFLMKRFLRNQNITSSIKYMIIMLVFILIIYISFNIGIIIISVTALFDEEIKPLILSIYINVVMMLYLILPILVVALNHPVRCCKCCRRSPGRAPLLPVNDTEGQQTNPMSVWDHRNVPSCTVTNLPYDMSDCRSDYEQLV